MITSLAEQGRSLRELPADLAKIEEAIPEHSNYWRSADKTSETWLPLGSLDADPPGDVAVALPVRRLAG